jgi:hypothetical protein
MFSVAMQRAQGLAHRTSELVLEVREVRLPQRKSYPQQADEQGGWNTSRTTQTMFDRLIEEARKSRAQNLAA